MEWTDDKATLTALAIVAMAGVLALALTAWWRGRGGGWN
jgi:hypothetical protein